MTNITYFSNILRDDDSSVDYSTDGSQFQENSANSDVSLVHRGGAHVRKKAVFWTIGKVYTAIAKSVNSPKASRLFLPNKIPPSGRVDAELVAAGWPSWLIDVSGESLVGWIPRRADSFQIIEKIGQGKHSVVYKGRDTLNGKLVALKKVQFDTLKPVTVRFMAREIVILRRLNHPNVIKLEALVTSKMSCSVYLVFEYMEHNLAGLAANTSIRFTESQIKCYMQQLFLGLEHCHSRGILHRDIKGSDLLLDKGGILKISDFGLASFFNHYRKRPMTTRVVSLWYRPPELLLGATHYGAAVDLWSAGCILAELLAERPIMPGRNEVDQLHKIFKLCGSPSEQDWKKSKLPYAAVCMPRQPYKRCIAEELKDFPPSSLPLIETLLAIDPDERQTATVALRSEFFNTKPYACEPSSLPQYPPSKLDAVRHDEDTERLRELHTLKGHLETLMRLKGVDIDNICQGYTV